MNLVTLRKQNFKNFSIILELQLKDTIMTSIVFRFTFNLVHEVNVGMRTYFSCLIHIVFKRQNFQTETFLTTSEIKWNNLFIYHICGNLIPIFLDSLHFRNLNIQVKCWEQFNFHLKVNRKGKDVPHICGCLQLCNSCDSVPLPVIMYAA